MNRIPSRKESTNSPSRLDLSCAADTENVQPFAGKDLVYHESNSNSHPSDGCYQGLHISQNPFTGKDSENSVGQKRQNLGIISEDGYCTDTIPRIQKSPKVPRIENCNPEFMLHQSNKGYDDRQKCGGDTTWQCWTDVCTISCFVLVHLNSQVLWQASCDNVSTMRQELKALDRDVKSSSNFFHSHCKLKGEPGCADTISLVQHHLKTRTSCWIICHDLQLWKVDHFEIKNGHYKILLSYHGYVLQRFTGTVGPASNIVISHRITKEFPNMDVQVAFGFVLNAEATKKSSDSFGTRNTTEQLDLKLCFLNFKSSRQVAVTLDMTCLKSGIYPSEILPHQIQASSESAVEKALSESLLAEMRAAAEILESGYTRIKRLCKCISNVV